MPHLEPTFSRKRKLKVCLIVLLCISEIVIGRQAAAGGEQDVLDENRHSTTLDETNIVRSLVIDGNESFAEQQIRALMRTDVWGTYDETVLKSDLEAITRFYRENGYRFARVDETQLSVKNS